MPGPSGPWGEHLVAAVRRGEVDEAAIDRKVQRILRLAARVGALEGFEPQEVAAGPDPVVFARRAAAEGSVLVRHEQLLPLDAASLRRVAVLGDCAKRPRIQGGGSATVIPDHEVTPYDGLRTALPGVELVHARGAVVHGGFRPFEPARIANPVTRGPGAHVAHYGADGELLYEEERLGAYILDFGRHERDPERAWMSYTTTYTPDETGTTLLGFASPGTGRLYVDGELLLEATLVEDPNVVQAFFTPPHASASVQVEAGRPVELRYEFEPGSIVDGVPGSLTVSFGTETAPRTDADDAELIAQAVDAARSADVAVVVVGTDEESECEGYDRDDLRLPGRQDDLVAAVAAANPRTVVVVNAGAPVEMPWRDDVAAVLLTWFGGQEYGDALADVLLGTVEPGGRLPSTWPARLDDAPVVDVVPTDGRLDYTEGIHVGYRAWLRSDATPAYPFGHGLGYTEWALGDVRAGAPGGDSLVVEVDATNIGRRAGKHVVQVYASRDDSALERPVRWLVGFAVVRAEPGETATARITVPLRAFAHWNGEWVLEPRRYQLHVGESVDRVLPPVSIEVPGQDVSRQRS